MGFSEMDFQMSKGNAVICPSQKFSVPSNAFAWVADLIDFTEEDNLLDEKECTGRLTPGDEMCWKFCNGELSAELKIVKQSEK